MHYRVRKPSEPATRDERVQAAERTRAAPPAPPKPAGTGARIAAWMRRVTLGRVFVVYWAWATAVLSIWAIIDISMAQNDLEEEGNPFANLVWVGLQNRVIEAAILGAMVGGVAVAAASGMQKKTRVQ